MTRGNIAIFLAVVLAPAMCSGANTLSAVPETVQLCPNSSELVRIVATPDEDGAFSNASLRWHTASGVSVSSQSVEEGARASKKYAAWLLKVTAPTSTIGPGTVHVFLVNETAGSPREVLASTSFKVASAIGSDGFPAKLELDSTWKNLNEGQRARSQVIVTNQSAGDMKVTGIRINSGPFDVAEVTTDGDEPAPLPKSGAAYLFPVSDTELAPGSAMVRTFDIYVARSARPASAKHRVQVEADVATTVNGCSRSATLVASSELGFAVLGNEVFLTAVGIPSFLVMPGFLMLMACLLLWKFGWKPERVTAGAAFPFVPKETEFWVLAITLSLPMVFLPGAVDRLANYRIDDVANVWLWSLAGAIAAYVVIVAGLDLWDWVVAAGQLSEKDDARTALKKLKKMKAPTKLKTVDVDLAKAHRGAGTIQRFLVPTDGSPGDRWTVPGIEYSWQGAPDTEIHKRIESARQSEDLPRLVDALLDGVRAEKISLQWDAGATLKRPARIAPTAFTEKGTEEFVQPG